MPAAAAAVRGSRVAGSVLKLIEVRGAGGGGGGAPRGPVLEASARLLEKRASPSTTPPGPPKD